MASRSAKVRTWIGVVVVVLTLGALMAPVPASAQVTDLGDVPIVDDVLRPRINPARDCSATYSVSDTILSARYRIYGTATCYQNKLATNGVVLDYCTGYGNPASCSTQGGFDPLAAAGVFTLTWTGVLGSSGNLTRVCSVTGSFFICTPG